MKIHSKMSVANAQQSYLSNIDFIRIFFSKNEYLHCIFGKAKKAQKKGAGPWKCHGPAPFFEKGQPLPVPDADLRHSSCWAVGVAFDMQEFSLSAFISVPLLPRDAVLEP